jgi:hypothetical protein
MLQGILWNWGPFCYNRLSRAAIKVQKVAQVVYNEFAVKKEWIFFKNIQVPVPVNSENFRNIDAASVKWSCQVSPPTFVDPRATYDMKPKHLSYLGFIIKMEGKDIDLSNWINDVLYTGKEEPSVEQIFILWCCEQGVSYFHCLDLIEVEYITELGDTVRRRV